MRLFLRKQNRLSHEKDISLLFKDGGSFFRYPVRLVFRLRDFSGDVNFRVMVVVSKRYFKRANKRNLLKRRLKESFRINQHIISENIPEGKTLDLAFIYVSSEILEYQQIEQSVLELLHRINTNFSKQSLQ